MQLRYDPKYNIAYLRLREEGGEVTTLHISDELNIDIAPDGTIHGIEFLNANEQLASSHGAFEIVNEASGHSEKIKLTG